MTEVDLATACGVTVEDLGQLSLLGAKCEESNWTLTPEELCADCPQMTEPLRKFNAWARSVDEFIRGAVAMKRLRDGN